MRRFPTYPKKPHHTGQARIRIDGRDVYLGVHDSPESWAEYERRLAAWRAGEVAAPRPDAVTVAVMISAWLTHCEERYAANAMELREHRRVAAIVGRLHGTIPITEFGCRQLETVQRAIATGAWLTPEESEARRRKGATIGCNRRTANRQVMRVKTCWRWAESQGFAPAGAWNNLRTVQPIRQGASWCRPTTRRAVPTAASVEAVAARVQEKRRYRPAAAMLRLQWLTGMRSSEVREMRSGEIDRDGIDVDGVRVWLYRPGKHKNGWREDASGEGQLRVVALGPACQKLLAEFLTPDVLADREAFVFRPRRYALRRGYAADRYAQAVRRGAERAGVALRPYDCRHGAKQRITRESGADAARAVLGHKSISTTQHYGGIDLEHAAKIAAKGA